MSFDCGIIGQRLPARRAGGERDKFRREQCVRTKGGNDIARYWRNPFVETDRYAHGISLVRRSTALCCTQVAHRDNAPCRRACVPDFGVNFDTGHVFVVDLQSARRFFQPVARERNGERAQQHNAARDDGEGHDVVGEVLFHEVLR